MSNFVDDVELNDAISGAKNAITGGDSLARDGISAAVSAAEMAFDPSGLAAAEFATETMVLLLRASKNGVKDPMLAAFIEAMADAGELTAAVFSITKDVSGIGIIGAIAKELAMQAAEGLGEGAFEEFNDSVSELPKDLQQKIEEVTHEQTKQSLDIAEVDASLKPTSLSEALSSRQQAQGESRG